ncbi:UDP-glucose--hexose-1-phosphate uridylyltransferase [Alkalihalobacterium bogoriense]|uniref:UDP-glucose--hexose-1-phosphate uridylyltransferase n=1 Tax=Alkalihalobacterium bogoriense TaxID=246272 RepID=UPI000555E867|nr:UDP-glucose--hexose-1-phosphate uridylyltransferase [Alkalihalobacterium bogoriense]
MSKINIYEQIERLIQYGAQKNLLQAVDVDYARNQILSVLQLTDYEEVKIERETLASPESILEQILHWAQEEGVLEIDSVTFRDLLDTKIMNCIMPRPSEVVGTFTKLYETKSKKEATDYFYELSKASHYIRTDRIAKNEHWYSETEYGNLEITINLSKPEKDPKAIAAAKGAKQSSYPNCLLCKENVGYEGRVNHPARQTHRIIPVTLQGEQWYFQYSPYVYYNEHAIMFSHDHTPMKISKVGFDRLLHFVEQFPHYFVGTNADLPIVGGSILSHDHFQGGHHEFPMAQAEIEEAVTFAGYENIEAGIVNWPMSVIRLRGEDRHQLTELADKIYQSWCHYSDETVEVLAKTREERHNTVTPIARFANGKYEFDVVLRNNRTNEKHPLGIFHPHDEVHHIKKENIGLIEVMGLAVLPGRLKEEMEVLATYLVDENFEQKAKQDERTEKHVEWALKVKANYPNLTKENVPSILKDEIGKVFSIVLEHAGVFKRTSEGKAAFLRFIEQVK